MADSAELRAHVGPGEDAEEHVREPGEGNGHEQGLAGHFGPSGFASATLFVPRRLARAFNDGSGLMGMPPRYFHDGRYGYETLAHELAHNWWGATVAERWLAPGTGGEWIVEGFAQATRAVNFAYQYLHPGAKAFPGHSSEKKL